MDIRLGKPLPDAVRACEIARADGTRMRLGELLRHEPTLLVFVRQFACSGCSERLTELLIHLEILQTAGVDVVVVGCGSVEQAGEFCDRFALGSRAITVVTDPTLAVHRAAGLIRSRWGVLGAKGTWNLVRAIARGHRNAWGHGDFYQLGGTVLLDQDHTVVVHHAERHLGETFPMGHVVDKALAVLARRMPAESRVVP